MNKIRETIGAMLVSTAIIFGFSVMTTYMVDVLKETDNLQTNDVGYYLVASFMMTVIYWSVSVFKDFWKDLTVKIFEKNR